MDACLNPMYTITICASFLAFFFLLKKIVWKIFNFIDQDDDDDGGIIGVEVVSTSTFLLFLAMNYSMVYTRALKRVACQPSIALIRCTTYTFFASIGRHTHIFSTFFPLLFPSMANSIMIYIMHIYVGTSQIHCCQKGGNRRADVAFFTLFTSCSRRFSRILFLLSFKMLHVLFWVVESEPWFAFFHFFCPYLICKLLL